jgi:drug/metabolite transporter (DMT)-like permease
MAVLLALASALVYGASDFCGGLATRRAAVTAVVALSQAAGLLLLLALLPVLGGSPTAADLAWGTAAGISGSVGLVVFYRSLARGTMSVLAPTTAVCAAAVPVLVGVALGDRIGAAAAVGILVALVAVVLVAAEDGLGALRSARPEGLLPALGAGLLFGLFFVLLDQTSAASGLWPLTGARTASAVLVGAGALLTRRTVRVPRPVLPVVLLAGVGDMGANALFLLATQRGGQLAIVGVLASLYPVSTVVLAQVVLRERLVATQVSGLVATVAAVVLISLPA